MAKRLRREAEGQCFEGQWLEINGRLRQPDFFVVEPKTIKLFETKLTYTERALPQLDEYAEALEEIFVRPVVKCVVAKNLILGDIQLPMADALAQLIDPAKTYLWFMPFPKDRLNGR